MIEYYPYAMANEKYARLAPPKTFVDRFSQPVDASQTMWNAVVKKKAHDPQLANLEDNMKRAGSLLIATMATLGLNNKILGVGEFLGFASWYMAMAATPKVINAMVWLKTGVNLGEEYINTQGVREQLYKDRKYLPLHLIPDDRMNFIADRLGIPEGIPDRRRLTEEKIAQVSVQGRTLWMLAAGPATVAISGLTCNLFENKIAGLINAAKKLYRLHFGLYPLLQKEGTLRPEEVIPQMDKYLEQKIGEISNSELSRWWRHFGDKMPSSLGLAKNLRMKDILEPISKDSLVDKIAEELAALGKDPDRAFRLENAQEFLKESTDYLKTLEKDLLLELNKFQKPLSQGAGYMDQYRTQIRNRIFNAKVTIAHYESLLKQVKGKASAGTLREWMEKPVLAEVLKLIDQGKVVEAKKYMGFEALYEEVRSLVASGSYQTAFNKMGASPANHLTQSLKTLMLGRLWKNRIVWGLGGGLLLTTAAFCKFVLGNNFGKNTNGMPSQFKRDLNPQEGYKWT